MIRENIVKGSAHSALGRSKTRADGIGTVTHKGQHAFFSKFGKPFQIGRFSKNRGIINFKVSRMKNHSRRRENSQSGCIGNTVICLNEFNSEAAQINGLAMTDYLFNRLCSFNLFSMRAMVSFVPYTGTLTSLRM